MNSARKVGKLIAGNATTDTTQYSYDLSGKLTGMVYPDTTSISYNYYPGSGLLQNVMTGSYQYAVFSNYQPTGKIGTISPRHFP